MAGRARRAGGRAARVAKRTAEVPEINPAPPGQRGGRFKPLTEPEIQKIYNTSLRFLEELGMGDSPDFLTEACLEAGAFQNSLGRLCFPRAFVEDIIDGACKEITLHGRDPSRSVTIGKDRVHYGTGGAAVQTLDLETGLYRPSTTQDLYDFARLQDRLQNISWFARCCVATDCTNNMDLDVNTAFALAKGTTKPIATSFFIHEHVDPIVEMFDMISGGEGEFSKRPWCFVHISPQISPFRYGPDAVEVTQACIRNNITVNCITAAQAGATAPAPPAGFMVTSLAETLASLIMVNVFKRGHPMVFSNWPFVVDLRSGAFCGGGGETALMNAASAQLSNWLGLPSGVASSMTDAKAVDAQMGMEKGITALAAGLAGANMVYESSGMMASILGCSFEAFLLDNEMHSHIYRTVRGIEVNDDTIAYDAITHSVLNEGHFLGNQVTMGAMQRDYFYPELANRDPPITWKENGAKDIWQVAREQVVEILDSYHPPYMPRRIEREIRRKYNILL
ncbi:MAG: trimethylamine methyltransferase family protein [Rhodobacteraceae bacterium]|nr:trimethylamine methyltransferase family protein [Paracoccaceae bacterium]